jgi:acetyl-CoA synthetase
MTETGHIITGHTPGLGKIYPLKPGTNGYSLPGINVEVLDDNGEPVKYENRGYYTIVTPWPGMAMTIRGDDDRFINTYWKKYSNKDKNKWIFYTGDFAVKDKDGYVWVLGRADDVLKVAGHRIGTAEVESAMVLHKSAAEAACAGKPDEVKGEIPVIFTVLKKGYTPSSELEKEIRQHLRGTIGPIIASDAIILFVDLVPKTRSGKIMRRLLKAVVSGQPLGDTTTLEDETAVEEAKKSYEHLKKVFENR